jgi:hypothetical protein
VSKVGRMIPNQGGSVDESTHWKIMINLSRTLFAIIAVLSVVL